MKDKISTEYAEALFEIALEQGRTEELYKELCLLKDLFLENPEYVELLEAPSIEPEKKVELVGQALGSLDEIIVNFVMLLVQRGRIALIYLCIDEYERLFNASRSAMVVTVISATELSDEQKQKIITSLERKYGCKIELCCEIDENILGGIIIKTEDAVLDGSLKKKLRDVKEVIRK